MAGATHSEGPRSVAEGVRSASHLCPQAGFLFTHPLPFQGGDELRKSTTNVKKNRLPIEVPWNLLFILLLAGALLFFILNGGKRLLGNKASTPTAAFGDIQISFKLDPRLLGPTYGGERWVSPSTYGPIAQAGDTYTVEARATRVDAQGQPVQIIPKWIPADPDMVTVSPAQGSQVTITVKRAGESSLQVTTSNGMSKTLSITAAYKDNVMQVEISQ